MTAHTHRQIVPGCYRCELGADEARMTAAETIAAAIEKLEREKLDSVPGGWSTYGDGILLGLTNDDGWDFVDAGEVPIGAARLIVTLHRTIDAQLAILREAQRWQDLFDKGLIPDSGNADLGLARAILGEVS